MLTSLCLLVDKFVYRLTVCCAVDDEKLFMTDKVDLLHDVSFLFNRCKRRLTSQIFS